VTALQRWSHSSLVTLQRCGEQFRRRYLERERGPSTLPQIRGKSIQRVAADSHRAILAGRDMSVAEARDCAATVFDGFMASDGVVLTPSEEEAGLARSAGRAKDFAVQASAHYVGTVSPRVVPAPDGVERKVRVKPRDMDVTIVGVMDLVEQPVANVAIIRDLKTSAKTPPRAEADTSQQVSMYAMLHLAHTGQLPDRLVLDHIIRTPTRGWVSYVKQETTRDDRDVVALVNVLNAGIESVRRGVLMPNTQGWWCDARYCEFWMTCPYVSARRQEAAEQEDD